MHTYKHQRTKDRCAIVGTAQTWRETPWDDPGMDILTLNDAYCMGLTRIDVQFELHPLNSFVFRPLKGGTARLTPNDLPPGKYMRPEGYLQWLQKQSQSIPVLLQDAPPADWPRAEQFPREHICETFRDVLYVDPTWPTAYVSSGPSWMLLYALDQGYSEIHIYGIHLATEKEYRDQQANFECLIGYAIAKGVKVVLPPGTPICKSTTEYCYHPRLNQAEDGIRWKMQKVDEERQSLVTRLLAKPWYRSRTDMRERLIHLDAKRSDLKQSLSRQMFVSQTRRTEWQVAMRG